MFYKCFNEDLTNRYGTKFDEKELYVANGDIRFGNDGNGFHVCKNLEDTLRFFDAFNKEVKIAKVNCFGRHCKVDDEYNEYYNMYSYQYMYIENVLTREEILRYVLKLPYNRAIRFISSIKLTTEEIDLIKMKFYKDKLVLDYIKYYQENDKEVFKRKLYLN